MKKVAERHTQRPENAENTGAEPDDIPEQITSTEGMPVIFPEPGGLSYAGIPVNLPPHLADLYPIISTGRPSKLTPELGAKILALICEGHALTVCCQAVGIDDSTLRKWRARAETGEEPYSAFVHASKTARDVGEVGLLREARAAGKGEWAKYITILERTRPDRWSSRQRIEVAKHVRVSVDAPPGPAEDLEGWQRRRAERDTPAEEAPAPRTSPELVECLPNGQNDKEA